MYIYSHIMFYMNFVFTEGARAALSLDGTMLGFYPVRVLPSKTAILPVNPTFLPRVWMNNLLDLICLAFAYGFTLSYEVSPLLNSSWSFSVYFSF